MTAERVRSNPPRWKQSKQGITGKRSGAERELSHPVCSHAVHVKEN